MGLCAEVQELKNTSKRNQTQQEKLQKEVDRLQKKLEEAREEKKTKKEYERDLKKAVEEDVTRTFCQCFERDGVEMGYINLTLKTTREKILANVHENDAEWHYLNENYEKILNKVKKIYINDENAKQKLLQMQLQEQQFTQNQDEKKQEIIANIIFNLLQIIFSPIGFILLILIFFIWGYFYFAIPVLNG